SYARRNILPRFNPRNYSIERQGSEVFVNFNRPGFGASEVFAEGSQYADELESSIGAGTAKESIGVRAADDATATADDFLAAKGGEVPEAYGTPYRQLTSRRVTELRAKITSRTITREEWTRLQWYERLQLRRQRGIDAFWAAERDRLIRDLPGTRNWSAAARADITAGRQPKGIFSHHRYSVSKYPQLADDPLNIYPVTYYEHIYRWHGGRWSNPTSGKPLSPNVPEWF